MLDEATSRGGVPSEEVGPSRLWLPSRWGPSRLAHRGPRGRRRPSALMGRLGCPSGPRGPRMSRRCSLACPSGSAPPIPCSPHTQCHGGLPHKTRVSQRHAAGTLSGLQPAGLAYSLCRRDQLRGCRAGFTLGDADAGQGGLPGGRCLPHAGIGMGWRAACVGGVATRCVGLVSAMSSLHALLG